MEKNFGKIWISLVVLAIAVIVWFAHDFLGAIGLTLEEAPFLIALTQHTEVVGNIQLKSRNLG